MSRAELEDLLLRLRRELEDLEETIYFNYRFTSAHIGGKQVRQDEETLRLHKDKIAGVETLLAAMDHDKGAVQGRVVSERE